VKTGVRSSDLSGRVNDIRTTSGRWQKLLRHCRCWRRSRER
jgi:hypothetical protein